MKYIACMMLVVLLPQVGPGADQPKSIPNKLVDYQKFQRIVNASALERKQRRISEEDFLAVMAQPDAVLLDARSHAKYKLRHIKGAVNLPFTEFSADSLKRVIPSKNLPVLIYCNNNFLGSPISFFSKAPAASLNISTYTALKTYGYTNIHELGPLLNVETTRLPFEGREVGDSSAHQVNPTHSTPTR